MSEPVWTIREAASYLDVKPGRIRQYLHGGNLVHGGYRRSFEGKVIALVNVDSVKRLKVRRDNVLRAKILASSKKSGW